MARFETDTPTIDPMVAGEFHNPEYLAHGGESITFTFSERKRDRAREVVAKLYYGITRAIVAHGEPVTRETPMVQEYITDANNRQYQLGQYFGNEHVLPKFFAFLHLPMNPVLYYRLMRLPSIPATEQFPSRIATVTTLQRRCRQLDMDHIGITAGYPELDEQGNASSYRLLTHGGLWNNPRSVIRKEDFIRIYPHEDTRAMMDQMSQDESFAAALREFVAQAVTYTNATGDILDLVGRDNIIFFKAGGFSRSGEWRNMHIDTLITRSIGEHHRSFMDMTRAVLAGRVHGRQISRKEAGLLLNTINYIRYINCLAYFLDVPEQIDIFDHNDPCFKFYQDINMYDLIKEALRSSVSGDETIADVPVTVGSIPDRFNPLSDQ